MVHNPETINIEWIPIAKLAWHTSKEQLEIVEKHISRVSEKRDRYVDGLNRTFADMEVVHWTAIRDILKSNLEGKTVQPS